MAVYRCARAACTVWLLMVLAVKGQINKCQDPNNSRRVTSVDGMTPSLTVDCLEDSNMVLLNMDSGGILVSSFVYIFEECVPIGLDGAEVASQADTHTSEIYTDYANGDSHQMQEKVASLSNTSLSSVVCFYHGCYESDPFTYDATYFIGFTAATNCTFSQQAHASSSHSIPSIKTMSSFIAGMQPSSSSNQLQPTPVTSLNKLAGSSVTSDSVPLITPSPLSTHAFDGGDDLSSVSVSLSTTSGSTMYQDTNALLLQLSFLLILVPVVLAVVFTFCIVQRSRHFRILKKRLQQKKQEWIAYYDDEPVDKDFSPVVPDMPSFPRFYSTSSILTDLDELNNYCSTIPDGSSLRIGEEDFVPCSEAPATTDKQTSLCDGIQSDDETEKQSNSGYTDMQDRKTSTNDQSKLTQHKRVFEALTLELFAYHSSLSSDEYVHLSAVHDSSAANVVTDIGKTVCSQQRMLATSH